MAGLDTNRGAKRAREARGQFGLDGVEPIEDLLLFVEERVGLPVIVGALPDEVAGALVHVQSGTIIWVNARQWVERQRFTLAHELGHVRCGHDDTAVDHVQTIFGTTYHPREVQANAFAGELLAPRDGVRELAGRDPGLDEVVRVAARYGISTIAALYRCTTLSLLSPESGARLKHEIEERRHLDAWDRLGLEPLRDTLAALDDPPRLSPALEGSALACSLRGETPLGAAAAAAGYPEERYAAATAWLFAP